MSAQQEPAAGLREIRELADQEINYREIRRFDASRDDLPEDEREAIRSKLFGSKVAFRSLEPGMELTEEHKRFAYAHGLPLGEKDTSDVLGELTKKGVRYAYHGTDTLTYAIMRGHWMFDYAPIEDDLIDSFSMSAGLQYQRYTMAGEQERSVLWHVGDPAKTLEKCERIGIPLSAKAMQLAYRGVVLAVDLRGYESFQNTAPGSLIAEAGPLNAGLLQALSPPPPKFVRPIAVIERIGGAEYDLSNELI